MEEISTNWMLGCTGASYTTTFNIRAYFTVVNDKVIPCPVHIQIVKGYRNQRYIYQLVPKYNYCKIELSGSANPKIGYNSNLWDNIEIHSHGKNIKLFIESAENGIIRRVWEDMINSVPGRFCYYPLNAEFLPTARTFIPSKIQTFFEIIKEIGYEAIPPRWYVGGKLITGKITPTKQGNLIGTSKIPVPGILYHFGFTDKRYFKDDLELITKKIQNTDKIEIKGNENNAHKIKFESEVEVLQKDRVALVHSFEGTVFTITHPQHPPVTGEFEGLVAFIHLARRA